MVTVRICQEEEVLRQVQVSGVRCQD